MYVLWCATKLIQLPTVWEDDECHLSITQNWEFISLLQQPISSFSKSHLPVNLVLDPLQFNSSSTHNSFKFQQKHENLEHPDEKKSKL